MSNILGTNKHKTAESNLHAQEGTKRNLWCTKISHWTDKIAYQVNETLRKKLVQTLPFISQSPNKLDYEKRAIKTQWH